MAATNTTAETAISITSLPFSIRLDPPDASAHLWFRYTAQNADVMVGALAWADDAGAYRPRLRVWRGNSPSTLASDTNIGSAHVDRTPIEVAVNPGDTYWFAIEDANATEPLGAPLDFSLLPAPAGRATAGDLFIPDDDTGMPGALLSPFTGEVKRFARFPGAEAADVLQTGEILSYDFRVDVGLSIFDRSLQQIHHITGTPLSVLAHPLITTDHHETWYVLDPQSDTLYTVNRNGSVGGTTWTLPNNAHSIAVSRDGTVLYYIVSLSTGIERWDLASDVALGAFAGTGVTGYSGVADAFVFADDSFLYSYTKSDGTRNFARRFAPDGTLIVEIEMEADPAYFVDRMCLGGDEQSFWTWFHFDPDFRRSKFSLYSMSGALLRTFEQPQSPAGFVYIDPPVQRPTRWGHANSCPILVLRQSEAPVIDQSLPCCPEPPSKPKAPGAKPKNLTGSVATGSPSTRAPRGVTGPALRADLPLGPVNIVSEQYWASDCEGGGDVPTAPDPTDSESWAS